MEARMKVSRAVTKAAFSHPFWGSLMLSLGHQESNSIPTACTDGRKIYWSPNFIDQQTEPKVLGLMAHEISHVFLLHCVPHPGKNPKLCNIAMDYVINNMLTEEGFELPDGGIIDEKREFINKSWEEVYAILEDCLAKHYQPNGDSDEEDSQDTFQQNGQADKSGITEERQKEISDQISELFKSPDIFDVIENSDLSEEEKEDIKQKVLQAAEAAKSAGIGNLPGLIEGMIKEIRTSKVHWQDFLITQLCNKFPEDYTMRRPKRSGLDEYDIYMPTMQGRQVGTIAIALDTSGSVSIDEQIDFLAEINEITSIYRPERVYLFYCDYAMAKEEVYEAGEEIDTLNTRGGGGTSFVPVFEHIRDTNLHIDQLIYFSDMEVYDECFPNFVPEYDVLWVSTREDYPVPFGTLIQVIR